MNYKTIDNPEIIIGLVGPIGVNLDSVISNLEVSLQKVGYKTEHIHLTKVMNDIFPSLEIKNDSYEEKYQSLIKCADKVREELNNAAAMAYLAIMDIRRIRKEKILKDETTGDAERPLRQTAYIIRQFKRDEEITLMRKIYGRKFIQVSIFLDNEARKSELIKKIKGFNSAIIDDVNAEKQAIDLIHKDNYDNDEEFGQRVSDAFPLGDVFVEGIKSNKTALTVERFIQAFFGSNAVSPTKLEYGMYTATAASLRSIDLSRQVGAAIFSVKGEIITQGCNEVPKAFGGTYWCDDAHELHRDFEEGTDGNHTRKIRVIHDLVDRLRQQNYLSIGKDENSSTGDIVRQLLTDPKIKESRVMDLIEFGRIIHAEMSAITDAARLGKSLSNSIMFCTTFPCHMCAKHIVSSGISKVIYLEPYPKSHAKDLHGDSITFLPSEKDKKVLFEPFIGISPRRYRDIFEKKKRKDKHGTAKAWYYDKPVPLIEDTGSAYIQNEAPALASIANAMSTLFTKQNSSTTTNA